MPPNDDFCLSVEKAPSSGPGSTAPAVSGASEASTASTEEELTVWLQRHREKKRRARKRPPMRSKLAPYRRDIVILHRKGASLREIQAWLKSKKRLSVHHATIADFLKKLPELTHDKPQ